MDDEKREQIIRASEKLESLYLEEREMECKRDRLKRDIEQLEQQLETLLGKRKLRTSPFSST